MKKLTLLKGISVFLTAMIVWQSEAFSQCQIPNPIPFYLQDFSAGSRPATSPLSTYQVPELDYVGTGNMNPEKIYTITPTSDLHNPASDWHIVSDHTGNPNGLMMLVNDREPAGITYRDRVASTVLGQGNLYYFNAWVMNILVPGRCTAGGNNPDIFISLKVDYKAGGTWTNLVTSPIFTYPSTAAPVWNQIGVNFTTPAAPYDSVRFSVNNESVVLCGNDYVLDDIKITGCVNNITLPVNLLSFTANYKNGLTTLNWEVENEVNFSHYEIERKTSTASSYEDIATEAVKASTGRSTYEVKDNINNLSDGAVYYRLKMVDIDGKFKYSNVILIRKDVKTIKGITISPNPLAAGDAGIVRFESSVKGLATFRVLDMTGRVVLQQQNKVTEGVNSIPVNNLNKLQPGMYIIQMSDGDNLSAIKFSVTR